MGEIFQDRPAGDLILWLVVAIVRAGLVAATFVIEHGKKELPPTETREAIEAPEAEAIVERGPAAGEKSVETGGPAGEAVEPKPTKPELDQSREPCSWLVWLRHRLALSSNVLAQAPGNPPSIDRIDSKTWDSLETTLIVSDLGIGSTAEFIEALRQKLSIDGVPDPERARQVLCTELLKLVEPDPDRNLDLTAVEGDPAAVVMAGANGTDKTTIVGKLAWVLVAKGHSVTLGTADTFRAATIEQFATWEEWIGVETVSSTEGSDPVSVASGMVVRGKEEGIDVILADIAGRLHTKVGLMGELGKVKRVIGKKASVNEVPLALDATTGQSGMTQARAFSKVVDVTGIVFTKLDGSAKSGVVVQIQWEPGVSVKFVSLGEGVDNLAPSDPKGFVAEILGE